MLESSSLPLFPSFVISPDCRSRSCKSVSQQAGLRPWKGLPHSLWLLQNPSSGEIQPKWSLPTLNWTELPLALEELQHYSLAPQQCWSSGRPCSGGTGRMHTVWAHCLLVERLCFTSKALWGLEWPNHPGAVPCSLQVEAQPPEYFPCISHQKLLWLRKGEGHLSCKTVSEHIWVHFPHSPVL